MIKPTQTYTINCRGTLLDLSEPKIMGILNLTPDSFSDGGRFNSPEKALSHTEKMISEGADIIDIGGYSSRPGATDVPSEEELKRVVDVCELLVKEFPQQIFSIDTFRSEVAERVLDLGIHMLNDISAGSIDPEIMDLPAKYNAPYILMHMQGTPQTMQKNPTYNDVALDIYDFLSERVNTARDKGINDLIIDPGFGFGKTVEQNYELFRHLDKFNLLDLPIMIGISRKSMIYKPFSTGPENVAELTAALHLQALHAGVSILRVHDVASAQKVLQMFKLLSDGAV